MDFDGNGTLCVSEFVAATIDETKLLRPHMIGAAFEMIDRRGRGYITSNDVDVLLGYWDDTSNREGLKEEKGLRRLTMNDFKKMMTGTSGHTSVITKPVEKWRAGISSSYKKSGGSSGDSLSDDARPRTLSVALSTCHTIN